MARPLRINAADLTYHVTARGTGRMPIYRDDQDRLTFLERLAEVVEDCHLQCHAYCLMTNHYHLVVRTIDANLSRALQRLNGPYAQWWNRRHERTGHVFQGRFGAQVIQDDTYLLTACRYVVLNPVRAGLVDKPGDWRWSSYRATAALSPVPPFLSPDALWRCLSDGPTESAAERYRQFVTADGADESRLPSSPVVGSVEFVERFESLRAEASREIPRRERQARPPLDGLFAGAMTRAARDRCATAAYSVGYRMTEVARFLDVHPSTVSKMIDRHRLRGGQIVKNPQVQDLTPAQAAVHSRGDCTPQNGVCMAKRDNDTKRADGGATTTNAPGATTAEAMEQRVVAFAEQLGWMVGTIQAKAEGWLDRATLHKQIASVRDSAAHLLEQLAGGAKKAPKKKRAATAARKGSRKRSGAVAAAPGRKRRKPAPTDPGATVAKRRAARARTAKTMETNRRRGRG